MLVGIAILTVAAPEIILLMYKYFVFNQAKVLNNILRPCNAIIKEIVYRKKFTVII